MHDTDESGYGIRLRTSMRRTSGGHSGVRKMRFPNGKRESKMLGELSIFTHPSIPDVPQPMFNFSSAASVMCRRTEISFLLETGTMLRYLACSKSKLLSV